MNRRLIVLLLLVVTFAVLGRSMWGDFTRFDDKFTVATNPRLNPVTWETLAYYWDPRNPEYSLYIPVTYTVWAGVAMVARVPGFAPDEWLLNPWLFHWANLAFHALSVLVVFAILRALVRNKIAAMLGALLFAIHPLQVESVAWISGLKDVLSGFFALLAIWCYIGFADEREFLQDDDSDLPLSPNSRYGLYALGLFCLILGMLSKPSIMTVPVLCGVIDKFVLRRGWREAIVYPGIWQIIILPIMWIAQLAQPAMGIPRLPLWSRPLIALDSVTFYIGKLILPFNLAIDYGRTPQRLIDAGVLWWTILVPIAIAIVVIVLRKDVREIVASALIFVLAPLPTLGLVTLLYSHVSTVADHYLYLAILGPALLIAGLVVKYPKPAIYSVSAALIVFAYLSFEQAGRWRDDFTLFNHTLTINNGSFLAAANLGSAYYEVGEYQKALDTYERGKNAFPQHFQCNLGYGLSLIRLGRIDDGIDACYTALDIKASAPKELRGDLIAPLFAIAEALSSQNRREEAVGFLRIALQTQPNNSQIRAWIEHLDREATAQPNSMP